MYVKRKKSHLVFGAIRKKKEYICMLYWFFVHVESLLQSKKIVGKESNFCNRSYFSYFTRKPDVATIAPLLEACSVPTNIPKPILESLLRWGGVGCGPK
jgi:hypothetical protein